MPRATTTAMTYNSAPSRMPMVSAQNMYAVSMGSFTAVRKRTMDRAPTMPMDKAISLLIHMTTGVVISVSIISVRLKVGLYSTPR